MIIPLDNNYVIELDQIGNHTLIKKTTIKDGKYQGEERNIIIGYYSNVASALKKYISLSLLDESERMSLIDYIERYEKLLEKAENTFRGKLR